MHIGLEDRVVTVGSQNLTWAPTEVNESPLVALVHASNQNEVVAYLATNLNQESTLYPPDRVVEAFVYSRGVDKEEYSNALERGIDDLDEWAPAMLECDMRELFEERLECMLFKLSERKCGCWQITSKELELMLDIIHADINLEIEMGELVVIKA